MSRKATNAKKSATKAAAKRPSAGAAEISALRARVDALEHQFMALFYRITRDQRLGITETELEEMRQVVFDEKFIRELRHELMARDK